MNIFEELQEKKAKVLSLAQKAADFGWIAKSAKGNMSNTISLEEIKKKIEKDKLTIGVIGQMKCGKSTFLNAFIFEDDILPAAITPMTAALTVITYGSEKKIRAEFYTSDEWAEQKMQAKRDLSEAETPLEESKIKAAKDLVTQSVSLGDQLTLLLNTSKEDSLDNLIEYVGAEGKYVSITKSVTIYYPKDYLKGVEIVDTPGFNDPIVAREERTKNFLKKADVVLMMMYAGRPYSVQDRDILFNQIHQCGIGKVLIGINKYDIPYSDPTQPLNEQEISNYVKQELQKSCRECNDRTLAEILLTAELLPISAEMALLSKLPMCKIEAYEPYQYAWNRLCRDFGISTQKEMAEWSHVKDLEMAIKGVIANEKEKILFAKPIHTILAVGQNKISDATLQIETNREISRTLSLPDDELEEREDELRRACKRIDKKIAVLNYDLDDETDKLKKTGQQILTDVFEHSCNELRQVIDYDWGRFKNVKSIEPKIEAITNRLITKDLRMATMNLIDSVKPKYKKVTNDFLSQISDILLRYIPDFDADVFCRTTISKINFDFNEDIFKVSNDDDSSTFWEEIGNAIDGIVEFYTLGLSNFFSHSNIKRQYHQMINKIEQDGANITDEILNTIFSQKDRIKKIISQACIEDLEHPLQEEIKVAREAEEDRNKNIKNTENKISYLEGTRKVLIAQLKEIKEASDLILKATSISTYK